MSEKGIRELAKEKFACSQCRGSRRVVTIGGIEAECKACRGFGTWGITIEEIAAFAESIVEQCCKAVCEYCNKPDKWKSAVREGEHWIHHALNYSAAECQAAAIRSRWQRGEGQ